MANITLATGHTYASSKPQQRTSFAPDMCGGCVIDAWGVSKHLTGAPAAPSERAMYRLLANIDDKYSGLSAACTGEVRYTRPEEEPYGAIDTVGGRRAFWLAPTIAVNAYVTVPKQMMRGPYLHAATSSRPAYIDMQVRLWGTVLADDSSTTFRAAPYNSSDITPDSAILWNWNGWKCVVVAGGASIKVYAPASTTTGVWTYPFPAPETGFFRGHMTWVWNGTTWAFYVNGEARTATASTSFVGTLTTTVGQNLIIGGAAGAGYEFEFDWFSYTSINKRDADTTWWRWQQPVQLVNCRAYPYDLADPATPDFYYNLFQGDNGSGLNVKVVDLLTDTVGTAPDGENAKDGWAAAKNTLSLFTVSGVIDRTITTQATSGTRYLNSSKANKALVNVSGKQVMLSGTEFRIYDDGTNVGRLWLIKGICFGGPSSYGSEYQNEGTPLSIFGQDPSASATPRTAQAIVAKDCFFSHTCDNAIGAYYAVDAVTLLNCGSVASIRISNHGEAPNHDFMMLAAAGARRVAIIGGGFLNTNQRTPTLFGSHGGSLTKIDATADVIRPLFRPQNDGTRNYQGAAWGQANNAPGVTTGDAHISFRQIIFEANRTLNSDATPLAVATLHSASAPAGTNNSTIFAIGNFLKAGTVLASAADLSGREVTRAKWNCGAHIGPLDETNARIASLTTLLSRAPTYFTTLKTSYETGSIVNHNQFVSLPGNITPNVAGNVTTMDGLLNSATTEWKAKANADLATTEFTGAVTAWADITNGTALSALIGTGQVAGATLWPLMQTHILNGFV